MKRAVARGAPPPSRRKPFSSKQKKQQLKEKRERKREKGPSKWSPPTTPPPEDPPTHRDSDEGEEIEREVNVSRLNQQPDSLPHSAGKYDPDRYRLHFEQESKAEIEERKRRAKTTPLSPVPETSLEVDVEDIYRPGSVLDIPKRPPWSYEMSKVEVERQEEAMFEDYLRKIHSKHKSENLSYFEHNLETWRQLWRVLEISDVVLLITDIRHPALHFSPALYNYLVSDLRRQLVLILNKVDLVPPSVVVAWRHYFLSKFPELKVVCFTSYPSLEGGGCGLVRPRRRRRGRLPAAIGTKELFAVIKEIYEGKINLTSWEHMLVGGSGREEQDDQQDEPVYSDSEGEEEEEAAVTSTEEAVSPLVKDSVRQGVLTIGMIGHPNVGKSSLLNGLVGKKVVSTSRTPGHTKHFQTIFLTPSVRLCDCPGLVFPSLVDKELQVLSGICPIAQVREPYTAVGYLAERLPLIQSLRLAHPDADPRQKPASADTHSLEIGTVEGGSAEPTEVWTAWDICDAWAERRGFRTSRAARLDTYRAANSILRMAVEGRVNMYFRPPGYSMDKDNWKCHPEVADMLRLQREGLAKMPLQSPGNEPPKFSDEEGEGTGATATKQGGTSGNKFSLLMALDDINL